MTSIGPKAPITPVALPSEQVTPVHPVFEQTQGDERGRDPQNPALDQDVSGQPQAQPQAPQPTLDPEAATRDYYARIKELTSEQQLAYIQSMRGARTL